MVGLPGGYSGGILTNEHSLWDHLAGGSLGYQGCCMVDISHICNTVGPLINHG